MANTGPHVEEKDTVVIGMGPAGLACALELAKKGIRVTLIENREDFAARTQRIVLHEPETRIFFKNLSRDKRAKLLDKCKPSTSLSFEALQKELLEYVAAWEIEAKFLTQDITYKNPSPLKTPLNFQKGILEGIESIKKATNKEGLKKAMTQINSELNRAAAQIKEGPTDDIYVQVKDIQTVLKAYTDVNPLIETVQFDKRKNKFEINSIDGKSQTLNLSVENDGKKISGIYHFKNLIDAGGASQPAATLLGKSGDEYITEKEKRKMQTRIKPHFQVTLTYDDNRHNPTYSLEKNTNFKQINELHSLGWDKDSFPVFYFFPNKKNSKFYVAGEIPESIQNMPNTPESELNKKRNAIADWAKKLLELQYNFTDAHALKIAEKEKHEVKPKMNENLISHNRRVERQQAKNAMSATAFPVDLDYVKNAAMTLGQKGNFILVGDARAKPNFHFGHGTADAISDAIEVGKCMQDNNIFNLNDYQSHHQTKIGSLNKKMQEHFDEFTQKHVHSIRKFISQVEKKLIPVSAFSQEIQERIELILNLKEKEDKELLMLDLESDLCRPVAELLKTSSLKLMNKNPMPKENSLSVNADPNPLSGSIGTNTLSGSMSVTAAEMFATKPNVAQPKKPNTAAKSILTAKAADKTDKKIPRVSINEEIDDVLANRKNIVVSNSNSEEQLTQTKLPQTPKGK